MAIVNPLAFVPTTPTQGVSVLFGAAQLLGNKPKRVVLDSFKIDCTLQQSVEMSADVSEFERETGSNVSDNRRVKPIEIAIAGLVSDTPIDSSLISEAVRLAAGPLNVAVDAFNSRTASTFDASISEVAFDQLRTLHEVGSADTVDGTFTVTTAFDVFDQMTIKTLRFTKDPKTGKALAFTVTLMEMRTVSTETTFIASPSMLQAPVSAGTKTPGQSKIDPDAVWNKYGKPAADFIGLKKKPGT